MRKGLQRLDNKVTYQSLRYQPGQRLSKLFTPATFACVRNLHSHAYETYIRIGTKHTHRSLNVSRLIFFKFVFAFFFNL